MSRIGKQPITVPADVTVTIDEANHHITVKGPKGQLERDYNPEVTVKMEGNIITVSVDDKKHDNLHGLNRTLIANMVEGVETEFKKVLQINGVGYRANKQGNDLVMNLGYSHQVIVTPPEGIEFDLQGTNLITVRGINKEVVGQVAAVIRSKRPPEVYKGKGIKYIDEHIRRKEGKTGKK